LFVAFLLLLYVVSFMAGINGAFICYRIFVLLVVIAYGYSFPVLTVCLNILMRPVLLWVDRRKV